MALGLPQPPQLIGLPVLSVTAARFVPLAARGAVVWPLLQAGRGRFNWAVAPADDPLWLPSVSEHHAGQTEALVEALRAEERPVWLVGELSDALRLAVQGLIHVRCIDPAADFDLPGQGKGAAPSPQRRGGRPARPRAGRHDPDPGRRAGPSGDASPARRLPGTNGTVAATLSTPTAIGSDQWSRTDRQVHR